jgi:hypothetical protein
MVKIKSRQDTKIFTQKHDLYSSSFSKGEKTWRRKEGVGHGLSQVNRIEFTAQPLAVIKLNYQIENGQHTFDIKVRKRA